MPDGTLFFCEEAVGSVNTQAGTQDIVATITAIESTRLSRVQQDAIEYGDYAFRITVSVGTRTLSYLYGTLTVTVPYSGETPVRALRLDNRGNVEWLQATFNNATSSVVFTTDRLSVFVVGYDRSVPPAPVEYVAEVQIPLPSVEPHYTMRIAIGNIVYTLEGVARTSDVAPFIDPAYQRTMIPLRVIAEGLGADVLWDGDTQTIRIIRDWEEASLTIGEPLPGGMGVAVMRYDRVFVPLLYVSEVLGAGVRWDGVARAAYIYG
jgi:hypothetical protein